MTPTTDAAAIVATIRVLDALPGGSVILDRHGDAASKLGDLWHYPETSPQTSHRVAKYAPITVLHNPHQQRNQDDEVKQRLARAAFLVDGTHHLYIPEGSGVPACSCGFVGDRRRRTQTEHITDAVQEAYDRD